MSCPHCTHCSSGFSSPYAIVGYEFVHETGVLTHLSPRPGSDRAFITVRLPDGTDHRIQVPYREPK